LKLELPPPPQPKRNATISATTINEEVLYMKNLPLTRIVYLWERT
jgi:hypothetical protein